MRVPDYGELTLPIADDAENLKLLDERVSVEFGHLVSKGLIVGAFPFGSTQFNDANRLSDYDIVVATDDEGVDAETRSFRAVHDITKMLYHTHGVPFEVTCYTMTQMTKGLHGFPDAILSWLKDQANLHDSRCIGRPFIDSIQPKRVGVSADGLRDLDDYIDRTRYALKKDWLQGASTRPQDVLAVALGTPHVVGRKVVDTLQQTRAVANGTLKDLTKASINEAVMRVFGEESQVAGLYREIVMNKQTFISEFIPEAHQLTAEEYNQIIEAVLEDNLPKCIELLRRMQESYREIYNATPRWSRAIISPYVERGSNPTQDELHSRMVTQVRMQQLDSW